MHQVEMKQIQGDVGIALSDDQLTTQAAVSTLLNMQRMRQRGENASCTEKTGSKVGK